MNEKKQPLGSILFNINEDHNIKLAKIKKNILVREHYNLDAIQINRFLFKTSNFFMT